MLLASEATRSLPVASIAPNPFLPRADVPATWLDATVAEWVRETAGSRPNSGRVAAEEAKFIPPHVVAAIVLQGVKGLKYHPAEDAVLTPTPAGKARCWVWVQAELGDWQLYEKLERAAEGVHPFVFSLATTQELCARILL